jgi:hypothetical protein
LVQLSQEQVQGDQAAGELGLTGWTMTTHRITKALANTHSYLVRSTKEKSSVKARVAALDLTADLLITRTAVPEPEFDKGKGHGNAEGR